MFEKLKEWREDRGLENVVGNIELNIYEELLELMGIDDKDEIKYLKNSFEQEFDHLFGKSNKESKVDALCDICVFAINAVEAMGYDFEKAMDETIKEISSRDGKMNHLTGKWEKDRSKEAMAKWYKADYNKARKN